MAKKINYNKMSNKELLQAACQMVNYQGFSCQSAITAILSLLTKKTPAEKVETINYLKAEFAQIY